MLWSIFLTNITTRRIADITIKLNIVRALNIKIFFIFRILIKKCFKIIKINISLTKLKKIKNKYAPYSHNHKEFKNGSKSQRLSS